MLLPKVVTTLQTYTRAQFVADLTAGIIVGIVALPLAIAFAIASGVTPERGLYTAVIAGFLISALGDEIGQEHLCEDIDEALRRAEHHLGR